MCGVMDSGDAGDGALERWFWRMSLCAGRPDVILEGKRQLQDRAA